MGCSNPHPHGQVWSLSVVPTLPAKELASLQNFALSNAATSGAPTGPNGRPCLLCEYAHFEVAVAHEEGRVIFKNDHWVALVPWWAIWPFEILCKYAQCYPVPALADNSIQMKCFHTSATSPRCWN